MNKKRLKIPIFAIVVIAFMWVLLIFVTPLFYKLEINEEYQTTVKGDISFVDKMVCRYIYFGKVEDGVKFYVFSCPWEGYCQGVEPYWKCEK